MWRTNAKYNAERSLSTSFYQKTSTGSKAHFQTHDAVESKGNLELKPRPSPHFAEVKKVHATY